MCPERIQPFPRHFPTTRWERAAYGDSHLQHRLIAQALTAELESLDIAKLACSSSRTLAHLQSEGRVVGDYRETVDRDGNSYAAKQSYVVTGDRVVVCPDAHRANGRTMLQQRRQQLFASPGQREGGLSW